MGCFITVSGKAGPRKALATEVTDEPEFDVWCCIVEK